MRRKKRNVRSLRSLAETDSKMIGCQLINEALIDEYADLEFTIKDKIVIGKPQPIDLETESIGTLLFKNLKDFPDHVGQINACTGEKTMFAEIKDRSVRCALWLQKQDIGEGDVICTSMPLQNDDYVPILATLFVGAVTNSWPHRITQLTAEYFFKEAQPKVMFSWAEGIDDLVLAAKNAQVDCKFVVVGNHPDYPSLNDLMAEQSQAEVENFVHVEPKDPKKQIGALKFTSGTTNNPKVVMLSYDTLAKNRYHHFTRPHTNILLYSTFSWTLKLFFFTLCIRRHLTRILHPKFDVEDTSAVIEKFKVNLIVLNPSMLTQLSKSGVFNTYDYSKLETIIVGGNKSSSALLEACRKALPNTHICNTLGMTDAAGRLTAQTKKCKTNNSIGRVVGSVQLKIVDPDSGLQLGPNQEGEMYFKANNLMSGYVNNPEETKKVIDDEGWLHSGDLGYYDESGEIWITDRLKNIIIYRTANLSPSKIEEILLQHPGVADVTVVPVPHEIDNERPFAFIVKNPGAEVTTEELKELPAAHDKRFRLTGGVAFLKEIPYNANGKNDLKELKRMALEYIEK